MDCKWTSCVLCVTMLAVEISALGPRCLTCDDVLLPRACTFVSRCGPNQLCSVKKKLRDTGREYYSVGCSDVTSCATFRSSNVTCHQCCKGDYCNSEGCDGIGYPPRDQRGPMCYSCSQQSSPENCDRIDRCTTGDSCYVSRTRILFDLFYSSRCLPSQDCVNSTVSDSNPELCRRCCTDDFCNVKCHGPVPPTITILASTNVKQVAVGQTVFIQCIGEGDPEPNVHWDIPLTDAEINESTVQLSQDKTILRIDDFQDYNVGNYTCVASNTHGTTSRTIHTSLIKSYAIKSV